MAVTTVDRRTVITDADSTTGFTGLTTLVSSPKAEGTNCVGGEIAPASGQTACYYAPGTALDLDGHLLYIQSYTNALQNGWKESTLSDSSHMLYLYDGTNELALCEAGDDRDVFKHAGGGQVQFQSLLIDLDYLSTKDTAGEIQEMSGTVGSFVETSVDRVGSAFHTESKALGGGQNCFLDIMRYDQTDTSGNSTTSNSGIFIYGGTATTDEGTFAEIVADDISTSADKGFGVIRELSSGIYGCQGILKFGTTNAVANAYFDDSDFILIFEDRDVNDDKFKIFLFGNSTDTNSFKLANGTIQSAGPGVELDWDSNDIDVINVDNVVFKDLKRAASFPTDSASQTHAIENCTFNNQGKITVGTVDFDNNTIINSASTDTAVEITNDVTALNMVVAGYEGTADTSALVWNVNADPNGNLDGGSFTKGTAATHAIEFGTSVPASMTITNMDFSSYNASDSQNDSAFYFADTGGSITLTCVNCTGNLKYKSAGATITIVTGTVTTSVHVNDNDGNNLSGAQVWLRASDGTGDLPFEQSISSITRSGTTATVNFTAAHGLKTNDYLKLYGITDKTEDNNGAHQVTYVDTDTVTYTTTDSGSTNYTGTITGTGGLLYGTTDASGDIEMDRSFAANQPFDLRVAKASSSPRFKVFNGTGTVSSADGVAVTVGMILDE